jgi:hypothetical protein
MQADFKVLLILTQAVFSLKLTIVDVDYRLVRTKRIVPIKVVEKANRNFYKVQL